MSEPTADDVRRAVLRDGIKGRDEEIARLTREVAAARNARIDPLLAHLRAIWRQYPDLRFTQLLLNVLTGNPYADYRLEDAELVTRLRDRYSVEAPGGQG